jgi:hypothetical protein
VAELLERARQLIAGGPYSPNVSEIIAVHAALYPTRDPVCDHCPAEQGKAYFAIKRWVDQQDNSSSTSTTLTVSKNTSTARFHSDTTTLFPHGLGVAYSNDNLTDKAARYILKNDPDAAQFFKVLPPDAEEGEDDVQPTVASAPAAAPAASTTVPTAALPAGFDYAALAKAMVDELERRESEREPEAPAADEQPNLTSSAGGAADDADKADGDDEDDNDDEKPVRLSRMNKELLISTYTAELGQAPAENLTNDELREAIAAKRASLPAAE